MQNRMVWILGVLALAAALVAGGTAFNGYRASPSTRVPSNVPAADTKDTDPLAPKLFDQSRPIRVHVTGAVRAPGVYSLPVWARVVDAVKRAGGATPNADLDAINLADHLKDAEQVRIPWKGRPEALAAHRPTPEPAPIPRDAGGHRSGRYPFSSGATPNGGEANAAGPVNINTATAPDLTRLAGIGPRTAEKIVAYRQEHGPFARPEELMNVTGIGPKKFGRIRDQVTVQ